jgi:hypothetical protein
LVAFFGAIGASAGDAQEVASSARIAAVQFALDHGLEVDVNQTVVIAEAGYMRAHSAPQRISAAALASDAQAIAKLIGDSARVAVAKSVLECVRTYCAASGTKAVLTVDEAEDSDGGQITLIQLYRPSQNTAVAPRGTSTGMIVEVRRSGNGWIGMAVLKGPTSAPVRVPPESGAAK